MSEAEDVSVTGTAPLPQICTTKDTESADNTPRTDSSQITLKNATPESTPKIRLISKNPPLPKPKQAQSETRFDLTRISLSNGGFYIPTQIYHSKDFIDNTYSHPSGLVSTLLYTELTHLLSLNIYPPDKPPLPNPYRHNPPPYSLTFPLWRQTATCGSHLSTWPILKSFLRQFRPCLDAAGEAFKKFRPDEYAHMLIYHDHLIRTFPTARNPGVGRSVWEDGYRTPFARMRVSVNVDRRVGSSSSSSRGLEDGVGTWFREGWKVVVLFGGWVGGRVVWATEWGEVFGFEEAEEGDVWVLAPGTVFGFEEAEEGDVWVLAPGTVFGNEGFVGQRVQVELFVPEVGYMGDDEDSGKEVVADAK
ncbi:hypothetical protein ONS95_011609 [Cadophora gregata]|uniref:uncharacterized protein n=1 Tax=Cadophora gregata TaxID=51156 RepID=UPI0026DABA57|nr:uncharacterized protein ONS95_011609 [Cadophora gregata]KAK0120203.1 hypothetical protein ONS95_011609 [Cadophora gregata]KAK0121236.1 hypothetical protein ONS96_011413 [Cadophora gregata f. sp. sojae]